MEQLRAVSTPWGKITYLLVRKNVKNLNLRIDRRGQVVLSVPPRCSGERADRLICEKAQWLSRHLLQRQQRAEQIPAPTTRNTNHPAKRCRPTNPVCTFY